jgi:diacylglycerol kinase family enzyme
VLEGPPQPMQLDGEPWGHAPFEARLLPAALSVIVDPATAPLGKGDGARARRHA